MKILGLIPARGGSKGIPRKNLAPLCGKPLIQWTIEAAVESGCFEWITVSTEDSEIAEFTLSMQCGYPRIGWRDRPRSLSTDDAPVMDTVWDALNCRFKWDAVFLLQPTNPLRTAEDIRQACAMLEAGAQSVVSYSPVGEFHPARMRLAGISESMFMAFDKRQGMGQCWDFCDKRRQELPPVCIRDGSVYLATIQWLKERHGFEGEGTKWLSIPRERSVRIDEPFDLEHAEFLLTRQARMANNIA